ncbi:MAG: UDP-glucose 4-epimerase GalE [Pseudomonadota bacterium]
MRILSTGGAGYVGSFCHRRFLAAGHSGAVLDDLSEGNPDAVPGGDIEQVDLRDTEAVARVLHEQRIDAVAHFASLISVPASISDPAAYWSVNLEGTLSLLDAMVETGVKRLVVSSTAAVYDHGAPMPLCEDAALSPATPYGASKLATEHVVRDYAHAYGLSTTCLRYFNAAGAEPDGSHGEARRIESHVIPLLMDFALGKRAKFMVFGTDWPTPDGSCIRDFISLHDLATAHIAALERGREGQCAIYNLGTGDGTSVWEVVKAARAVTGLELPVEEAPRRPGDPAVLVADSTKARSELGWQPARSDIGTILRDAWAWHKSHPDGYGTVWMSEA